MVTACSAYWVVIGDVCRKAVWPLIEAEPRVDLSGRHGLDDTANHFADIVTRALVGAEEATYYSTDLTAAKDYMPHAFNEAIWRGVMAGLGVELLFRVGLKLHGPARVSYPDLPYEMHDKPPGLTREGFDRRSHAFVRGRRGCMMGLPLSWFCLDVYNIALADMCVDQHTDAAGHLTPILGGSPCDLLRG